MHDREKILTGIASLSRARAALSAGDLRAALDAAELALRDLPDHIEALGLAADAARKLGARERHRELVDQICLVAPYLPGGWTQRGLLALDEGDSGAALAYFNQAVDRAPLDPVAHHNVARAAHAQGRQAMAAAALARALALEPGTASAWSDLGAFAREDGALALAMRAPDRALALEPGASGALWNRGLARLLAGDLTQGFEDYEVRWRHGPFAGGARHQDLPPLDHGPALGRRVLVWAEQGLGDSIQFARYVAALQDQGAKVTLEVPPSLVGLLRGLARRVDLVAQGEARGEHDAQIALGSLPRRLGAPFWPGQPYLAAPTDRHKRWGDWLAARVPKGRLTLGLVWQGNPAGTIDRGRSVPLASLRSVVERDDIAWICLQKRHGLDQIAQAGLGDHLIMPPEDFDEGPDGFLDSAALIKVLDGVVTSDTSIAHLTGAMGARGVVLLKAVPDWRWGMAGQATPWYPSLTLLRQEIPGDWGSIARDLGVCCDHWGDVRRE